MRHFSIHKLEREIADVIKKGFKRDGFDDADCLQAGHDIADFLLASYRIEEHPYKDVENMPLVPSADLEGSKSGNMTVAEAYEHFANRLGSLQSDLARWAGTTGEER